MPLENISREEAKKAFRLEKARRNLFEYMSYTFPFQVYWNWHHKYVCGVLQQIM